MMVIIFLAYLCNLSVPKAHLLQILTKIILTPAHDFPNQWPPCTKWKFASIFLLFYISLEGPVDREIGVPCIVLAAASSSVVHSSQPIDALAKCACHSVSTVHLDTLPWSLRHNLWNLDTGLTISWIHIFQIEKILVLLGPQALVLETGSDMARRILAWAHKSSFSFFFFPL